MYQQGLIFHTTALMQFFAIDKYQAVMYCSGLIPLQVSFEARSRLSTCREHSF